MSFEAVQGNTKVDRFVAPLCRKVVVADRYGTSDLAENNGIASQKRDWFLNQLDRCGSQVRVTLLVGDNKQKNSGQRIADEICSQFSSHRGGVKMGCLG